MDDHKKVIGEFEDYMRLQNYIVTALCVPMLLMVAKSWPQKVDDIEVEHEVGTGLLETGSFASDRLPSFLQKKRVQHGCCNEFKLLLTNRNYIVLIFGYAFLYGCYTSLGALISPLLSPEGFNTH